MAININMRQLFFSILNYFSNRRLKKAQALKRAERLEELKKRDPFVYPHF